MMKIKYVALSALSVAVSVLPVAAATLSYFSLWRERGSTALLSGTALLLLLLASAPIFKLIKRALASPSIPLVWLLFFLLFFTLRSIADEITVISLVGFISNSIGAALFKLAEKYKVP